LTSKFCNDTGLFPTFRVVKITTQTFEFVKIISPFFGFSSGKFMGRGGLIIVMTMGFFRENEKIPDRALQLP